MLIVFKIAEPSHSFWKMCITQSSNKAAEKESLNLKSSVYKERRLVFWKKNETINKIELRAFVWTCYTWNKCNMENAIFFLIQPKSNSM